MPRCSLCRARIDELDFYFETDQGRVCSSCLVVSRVPRDTLANMFPPPDNGSGREREMNEEDLRQAVWSC